MMIKMKMKEYRWEAIMDGEHHDILIEPDNHPLPHLCGRRADRPGLPQAV